VERLQLDRLRPPALLAVPAERRARPGGRDRARLHRDHALGLPARRQSMTIAAPSPDALTPGGDGLWVEDPTPSLDARVPDGPIEQKWERRRFDNKLVAPANRRRYSVIVVGTGLAGASAAAALGEQGYNLLAFCIHASA